MAATNALDLDASGNVAAWHYELWSNTHSDAAGLRRKSRARLGFAAAVVRRRRRRRFRSPKAGGDRNAIPLYRFPRSRVVHHFVPEMRCACRPCASPART